MLKRIIPSDYHISTTTGFLLENPLETLPEYFHQWTSLAENIIDLVTNRRLRDEVAKLPLLNYKILCGHRQHRLAHLQLAFITAGYVWQDGDEGVPKCLPKCISIPFCAISDILGIQPILSHCDLVLANWKPIDENKSLSIKNLRCIYHLPGGANADWFVLATVVCELQYARAIQYLTAAIEAAENEDAVTLKNSLEVITGVLFDVKKALSIMHEGLNADTFYNVLRPFLSGWGGDSSPLPKGLLYEGVYDSAKCMIGGSAAQSSTLQSVDAALSVHHEPEIKNFFLRMRLHMPPSHRQFIEDIQKRSQIKAFVTEKRDPSLTSAFDACVEALVKIRSYHIQVVTKYVIIQSNKVTRNDKYEAVSKKGTGGSSLLPFLREARTATKAAGINNTQ